MKMYEFHYNFTEVPINNITALVQIMAWRLPGDKSLSEPMMISWLTHICVTRPHCVDRGDNSSERIVFSRKRTLITPFL